MLTEGGAYAFKRMQYGATAAGNGSSMAPLTVNGGSYALLTAQIVGLSGDTITWEATIDEVNWVSIPALNISTREIANLATGDGLYRLVVTSFVQVRARISSYSAGVIYVYGLLAATGEVGLLSSAAAASTGPVSVSPTAASAVSSAVISAAIQGSLALTPEAASAASGAADPTVSITGQSLDFSKEMNSMYLGLF